MLIDEQFRKAAGLLWVQVPQPNGTVEGHAAGTAFFVGVHANPEKTVSIAYAVTALHVVYAARPFGPLHLRLNIKDEHIPPGGLGFADLPIDSAAWIEHPTTDVAIAPMPSLNDKVDWRHIPDSMIAGDEYVRDQAHRPGVGDEIFFAGLFSQFPGRHRFQPIIRFGNISMMPHEKVPVEIIKDTTTMVDAYLVEARSWGGHSGSPAYIYYSPDRQPGSLTVGGQPPALLGLVSAHFPIPLQRAYLRDSLDSTVETANTGIAVVIPGQAILDLLMDDEQVRVRRALATEFEKNQPTPTMDTGLPEPDAGQVLTRQYFYDGLRRIKKQPKLRTSGS